MVRSGSKIGMGLARLAALALAVGSIAAAGSLTSMPMCTNEGSGATPVVGNMINANSCTDFLYSGIQGQNEWQYGYYQLSPTQNSASFMPNGNGSSFVQMQNYQSGFWAVDFNHYWTSQDAFQANVNAYNTDLHPYPNCDPNITNLGHTFSNCGNGGYDPNNSQYHVEQWAVRQFDIPTTFAGGLVNISVMGQKVLTGGQNTQIYVFLLRGGQTTMLGDLQVSANGNPVDSLYLPNFMAQAGDKIDFALAPTINQQIASACAGYLPYQCPNHPNDPGWNTSDFSDNTYELFTIQSEIPEPATFALIGCGLLGLGGWRLRRNRRKN